jgi:hypothetical protein
MPLHRPCTSLQPRTCMTWTCIAPCHLDLVQRAHSCCKSGEMSMAWTHSPPRQKPTSSTSEDSPAGLMPIWPWTWGAPSTNITTERSHCSAHEHLSTLQVGAGHIESTESLLDVAMHDNLRDNAWNTKVWDNHCRVSHYQMYPPCPHGSPIINPIAASVPCRLPIEVFDTDTPPTHPSVKRESPGCCWYPPP